VLESRRGVAGERILALPGIREWSAIEEEKWAAAISSPAPRLARQGRTLPNS